MERRASSNPDIDSRIASTIGLRAISAIERRVDAISAKEPVILSAIGTEYGRLSAESLSNSI